ncbi:pilus assembly protein PilM [Alkalicella caledoniensis]|uniref:Pilus assembly protein PilM n=1 Tax=Alkalicella caledoniensis TaxID=2731377 RepID=A0A7G9WBP6_ALKCA|nr:pilus assembly protein PilM [Alkalicella caledoniensis]QNO16108.1 pilus assembly protein PilM [Alkalicella caledoniensis]
MFNSNFVAIDIGSGYIKLFYQDKVYEIQTPEDSISSGVISDVGKIAEAIKALVLDKKLQNKSAVLVYNGPSVFTKVVKIPMMSETEIQNYLELEADNIVPFPAKEGVLDYIVLKKDVQTMEILAMAIKNELVIPYINVIQRSGLTPLAIDIPAMAIARKIFKEKEDGLQLVVDIGNATTDIHIYQNSIFSFSRSINIGGADFDNILSASMGIDKKVALKDRLAKNYQPMTFRGILMDLQRELNRSFDYFRYRFGNQQSSNFTKVYLIGGNSNMAELTDIITEVSGRAPQICEESKNLLVRGLGKWRLNP